MIVKRVNKYLFDKLKQTVNNNSDALYKAFWKAGVNYFNELL